MSDDKRYSDCGCWTDAEGFWQLSQACWDAEMEEWARIIAISKDPNFFRVPNVPTTPHERAVHYFRQELSKR